MADDVLSLIVRARDEASAQVGKVSKALDGLGTSAAKAGKDGSMLSSVLSGIGAGVGIAGVMGVSNAVGRLTDFLGDAARAAMEDERSVVRLGVSLRDNVTAWSGNTAAVERAIASRTRLGFADDTLRQALGTLVTRTHDVRGALRLMDQAMDLARFRGIDLSAAVDLIGKAFDGNVGALRRAGIAVSEHATAQEALAAVLKATGGQAEAYADTAMGKMEAAQIRAGEAVERVGYKIMPAFADALDAVSNSLENVVTGLDNLGASAGDGATKISALDAAGRAWDVTLMVLTAGASKAFQVWNDDANAQKRLMESLDDSSAAMKYAAINADVATTAYVNTGRAALFAAERVDILRDAQAGADMTAKIAATGAWTATSAFYAQAAGLDRASMGATAHDERLKKLTGTMGSASNAAERLRQKVQNDLTKAFDAFKKKALDALDAVHEKKLRAIDDAIRLRQAEYDAAVAAIQGPIDAARAALDEARAKRDVADAQRDLNEAIASGDARAIEMAQRRLDDLLADQKIAAAEKEARAKIDALTAEKEAKDAADEEARKKIEEDYRKQREKLEEDLKLLEDQLENVDKTYKQRVTRLLQTLKKYGIDFETLGKDMGDAYAKGVVTGLEKLIPSIANKVAELLGVTGPGQTGTGVGAGLGAAGEPESEYTYDAKGNLVWASGPNKGKIVVPAGGGPPPGKAAGGPVSAWTPYVVGEKGPELFVPKQSGTVVPNHALTGPGVTGPISITVNAGHLAGSAVEARAYARQMADELITEFARRGIKLGGPGGIGKVA